MVKRRRMSDKMSVFCSAPSHTLTLLSRNQPPSLRCCCDTVPGFTVITLLPLKSTESLLWGSVGTLSIEQVVQELKKLITFCKTPIWHQRRCRGLKTTSWWMTFIWAPCLFVQTTSNHWLNSKEWTTQCINTMMSKRWQEDKKKMDDRRILSLVKKQVCPSITSNTKKKTHICQKFHAYILVRNLTFSVKYGGWQIFNI